MPSGMSSELLSQIHPTSKIHVKTKIIDDVLYTQEVETNWSIQYIAESGDRLTVPKRLVGDFDWNLLKQDPYLMDECEKNQAAITMHGCRDSRVTPKWRAFITEYLKKKTDEAVEGLSQQEIDEIHRELDEL